MNTISERILDRLRQFKEFLQTCRENQAVERIKKGFEDDEERHASTAELTEAFFGDLLDEIETHEVTDGEGTIEGPP